MNEEKFRSNLKQNKKALGVNYAFDVFKVLLTRMLENIKADRGALVLLENGGFKIEAEAINTAKGIVAKSVYQLKNQTEKKALLPESILRYVIESGKQLTLDHPSQDTKYSSDHYFKQVQPAFIYCSPTFAGSTIEGVLYLESQNSLSIDDEERNALLSSWADQASLSLENTKWFSVLQEDLKDRMHEIREVKKENKARIQFLADVNHEVMSPLNSIVGFSQLLMKKDYQLHFPPEVRRYLENIQSSGNKLAELLDNVLEYSRIDAGKVELIKEHIDVRLLLNTVYSAHRELLNNRRISLNIEVEQQCPNTVFSDRSVLTKVLLTMLKYAIHRSSATTPVILKVMQTEDYLQFNFSDHGDPISKQDQENLFSAFTYKKNLSQQQFSELDSNLDLAISRQMVERLHGNIEYKTLGDKTAEIIIKIPCGINEIANDAMGAWRSGNQFPGDYRVLLLKDRFSNWDLLDNILKDLGLKTYIEAISPTTLPRLVELNPHLMFIDLHMPGMDDKAKIFIRYLRTTRELKNIPLIATTTDKYHGKYQSDYQSADIEFLLRPFSVGDIVKVLKKHQGGLLTNENSNLDVGGVRQTDNLAKVPETFSGQKAAINQLITKELEELTSIPIYLGGTIINRLNQIKENHGLIESKEISLIGNLKSAVFEGDADRFLMIIKKAIESNHR